MGAISNTVFTAASAGMNLMQKDQGDASAELKALDLETQARRKDAEAKEAHELGRLEQAETVVEGRREIAAKKTEYASSGVDVNSGSALEVAADKAAWTEYERQKVEYNAEMKSWGLRYDAEILRRNARQTRASASGGSNSAQKILAFGKQIGSLFS